MPRRSVLPFRQTMPAKAKTLPEVSEDVSQANKKAKVETRPISPALPAVAPALPAAETPPPCVVAPSAVAAPACGPPPKPCLPARDVVDVDTITNMRAVIAYVKFYLREHMKNNPTHFNGFADVDLHSHSPLSIKRTKGENELLSFKAAWNQDLGAIALRTTLKYEAGGNIFWFNPFTTSGENSTCAGEVPSWAAVHSMAEHFRSAGGANKKGGRVAKEKRLMFTMEFLVHARRAEDFHNSSFPGNMNVVAGHAALYGWYLATFEELVGASTPGHVAALVQAALTATVRAHVVEDHATLALLSMAFNAGLKTNEKAMTDGFPIFARKLRLALTGHNSVQARLDQCTNNGIRYNTGAVHRTLLLAAFKYVDTIDDATHAQLMRLERRFGKDVLTGKWNNLNRVIQLCGEEMRLAEKMWGDNSVSDLVGYVVSYISWALEHEEATAVTITQEWLDKTRDGKPGVVARVLAKQQLVAVFEALVLELPEKSVARTNLSRLVPLFASYSAYNAAFHDASASTPGDADPDEEAGGAPTPAAEAEEAEDPFETVRKSLCKTGATALDFLFDIFACEVDDDLNDFLQKYPGASGLLQWSNLEGKAGQAWRELTRQLGLHKHTVAAAAGGMPPPATGRALKRVLSQEGGADIRESEIEAERLETWKTVVTNRKKFATASVAKFKTADQLQTWLEKQTRTHQFVGKVGESHRVFVFSADTFGLESAEPWRTREPTRDLDTMMTFMSRQTGPCDIILAFDGRNVADRKKMCTAMESTRHCCELWIVYAPTKRMGRRVAWASDAREVGWISLPVPRTNIATKERGDDKAAWAASTHDSVYSGVPPTPWDGLPMLSVKDKARAMDIKVTDEGDLVKAVPRPPAKLFDTDRGLPLYWNERKPVEFWEDILWAIDASSVVDLSPGSAAAGRACLRLGIHYVAACRNEAHGAWVNNILDREACELTVQNESPLFEQDSKSMLEKHFGEVLTQLEMQRNAEDREPEDDVA